MDIAMLQEWISFVFGEIVGDSILLKIFSNEKKKSAKEKRYEFLMPIASILCSMIAVRICSAIGDAFKFILEDVLPSGSFLDIVLQKGNGIEKLDFLGKISSIACFMYVYLWIRKKAYQVAVNQGKRILGNKDSVMGMYIPKGNHGEYQLAKRWRFVKNIVKLDIGMNCILIAILYILTDEMAGSFFSFKLTKVLPIICLVFLVEVYKLLSCAEEEEEEEERAEVIEMDLIRLLSDYQQYARDNQVSASIAYQEHSIKLREESWDYQRACRLSEDSYIQYFMKYLDEKERDGRFYSSQCLDTVVRLIRGENVFFATPFYKDADICIFFPVFLSLLRREKALILLEDNGNLQDFCQWLKHGIEEIQDLVDFWEINIWDENMQEADVGILSFQNICHIDESIGLGQFLAEVSFAVVLEAADLLVGGQEVMSHLAEMIGTKSKCCTWFLCDRNGESVLDLFSHLFDAEFGYVSATPLNASHMVTAFWDLETEPVRPWKPPHRYLGIGAGIMQVAGCNKVKQITWYGEEVMPLKDLKWILGQYYLYYGGHTGNTPQQVLINNTISCEESGIGCERDKEKFIIVEDANFNLYEVQRQFATRAEVKLVLHILSPNYMFRNYMRAKEPDMKADAKYIAQFVPEYVSSNRNVALKLIRHLLEKPVSEEEVEEILHRSEEGFNDVLCMVKIRDAVNMVLNIKDADIKVTYISKYSQQSRSMKQEPCYQLVDMRAKKKFSKYFRQAKYIDESGRKKYVGQLFLAGHLELKYLPGQFVTLDNKYYEVKGYYESEYEKLLEVKRASEQIFKRHYYRQLRWYKINKSELDYGVASKVIFSRDVLKIERCVMDIDAHTCGYVDLDDWNNIEAGRRIKYSEEERIKRKYTGKQILKVTYPEKSGDRQTDETAKKKVAFVSLAVMLNEALCTFYPKYYHLLSIAMSYKKLEKLSMENGISEKVLHTVLANIENEGEEVCFYILEDSAEDMGLLRSLERNFQRIINILQEYMEWREDSNDGYIKFGK